ncbi:MAG: V-type ATP synthase subunit E family protein [Actinomycetia bacterium]|nr:V-type ATP synthase subunit E family protein [Actinomycetes bacterium]
MAIEEILSALNAQAQAEIDRETAQAQAETDEIIEGIRHDAQATADAFVASAVEKAKGSAERDFNAAQAVCRRQRADVRREVFDEVFVRAGEKIKAVRSGGNYPHLLRELIIEATSGMGDYVLHVDPRDKDLVMSMYPGGVSCVADIETMGGIVVTSVDGRIRRSSTFEDRLKRVQEDHIESIAKVLGV